MDLESITTREELKAAYHNGKIKREDVGRYACMVTRHGPLDEYIDKIVSFSDKFNCEDWRKASENLGHYVLLNFKDWHNSEPLAFSCTYITHKYFATHFFNELIEEMKEKNFSHTRGPTYLNYSKIIIKSLIGRKANLFWDFNNRLLFNQEDTQYLIDHGVDFNSLPVYIIYDENKDFRSSGIYDSETVKRTTKVLSPDKKSNLLINDFWIELEDSVFELDFLKEMNFYYHGETHKGEIKKAKKRELKIFYLEDIPKELISELKNRAFINKLFIKTPGFTKFFDSEEYEELMQRIINKEILSPCDK